MRNIESTTSPPPLRRKNRLRKTAFAGALGALMTAAIMVPHSPAANAQAAPSCSGNVDANRASGLCNVRGTGGPKTFPLDPNFALVSVFEDQPCIDKNGTPSHMGTARDVRTGGVTAPFCLTQANGTGSGDAIKGVARELASKPKVTADFKGDFLIGTPIKFSAAGLEDSTTEVPNFPGVNLVLTAQSAKWDFGDGTTSENLEATHTYENIAPNPDKPDDHSVTVTMTGTFNATILDTNTGTSTDIGTIQGTGNLTRQIVQVWSKQTEPTS